MTGPKGNSEFCFPETLNVFWGEAEGSKVEGPVMYLRYNDFPLFWLAVFSMVWY